MDGPRRSGSTRADGQRSWRPSFGYLFSALAIVAGGLAYWTMSTPATVTVADGSTPVASLPVAAGGSMNGLPIRETGVASRPASNVPVRAAAAASTAAPAAAQQVSRTQEPDGDLTADISVFVNKGERPTMGEVIERLHQAGVYGGLGAFPPPGTRPPLVGLAVPEDFVLPEGYVRHHQSTDDGQRIEPILMYSPDHAFFDANRQPIAIPQDRVVPPELAPPGLPIRRIVIPAPTEPGRPGR